MKALNIITGKEVLVRVIDWDYNDSAVEVEIMEAPFKGKYAIVNKADLISPVHKGTASMKFSKWEAINFHGDREGRFIDVDIVVKSKTEKGAEGLMDAIREAMESADGEISFARCTSPEEVGNGFEYAESFIMQYCHSEVAELKENLRDLFKQVKKDLI